ncbi:MAG: DUF2147 domain-containing protein [Sphingobacteriaceae bacterium]|nr:DUF2147 domain-containing protein [Sphingobacteriaceae bacterium]
MFKKLAPLFLLITLSSSVFAQKADDILGKWLNSSGEGQIEIYKKGDKYFGKLVWIKEPNENGKPKLDIKNPDAKLKSNPLLGLNIVKDFAYDGVKWTEGKVYDPKTGKTYSGNMSMTGLNQLNMRGYIGISLIGRTENWKRVK